ncbi:MAG: helix-turn-helix domain-containing protein [Clostridium sp.]|nr:helix-turn-helix domain-containing protein [Clostridium sp.]
MLTFNNIYRPLTARPFLADDTYREYSPCVSLAPYVACYWTEGDYIPMDRRQNGSHNYEGNSREVLVIPDTCMDIIVNVNHTSQKISGYLCGIQDKPFLAQSREDTDIVSSFAIRFHFWAASFFFSMNLKDACNQTTELEALGEGWGRLFDPFFYLTEVEERIAHVEAFLLQKLDKAEENPDLLNSIQRILSASGAVAVRDICEYSTVSQRQIERLFLQKIGMPPKKIASLVRYQNVWREIVTSESFNAQNAVYRYGYTDQAHLLKEFRRFHGTNPEGAKKIAIKNQ